MVADLMTTSLLVAPNSRYQYLASTKVEAGMYQFVDQPVEHLGNGSRFVLWAMRGWTNALRRERCPRATIGGAFVNMDAGPALPDFHALMVCLHRAGPVLRMAPLACKRIGEGEAVLLALWQDVAAGRHGNALAALRLILPAASADLIGESLAGAVDHLRQSGLEPAGLMADRASNKGEYE
jgi:hypothetical protein